MEKESVNNRIAVSALVATFFSLGLGVAIGLAQMHPMPGMIVTVNGTIMTVTLFALPLVWWGLKVGHICAIAVGAVNVIGDVAAIASGLPFSEGMPQGTIAVILSQIIASLLVVVYCIRAWREA